MDYRLGALTGALVGDAAGATLEFKKKITPEDVAAAMKMRGGGSWNVAPGQITDDGELTLALCSVLSIRAETDPYPLRDVALAYSEWFKSRPFDCGSTCRRAFGSIVLEERERPVPEPEVFMKHRACVLSEANGALMRASPIGVFYHNLPYDAIANFARQDACLSHPSKICQDVNALYAIAIPDCINNPGNASETFRLVENWPNICPTVKGWIQDSKGLLDDIHTDVNIGHVKHAFTLAFYFLQFATSYDEAIRKTLEKGGDTDTNACIVGGLMGAGNGYKNIRSDIKGPVFAFDCAVHDPTKSLLGYRRPEVYKANNIFKFLGISPS